MKKSLLYILSSLLLVVAGGCSDDLNLSPISNKNIEGFYKTQSQFEQAIIGCYHGLRNANLKSNFSYQLTECRSDNAWQQVDYDDGMISRFTENAATPVLNTAWADLYNTVMRCNYILTRIEDATFDDEGVRKQIEGEARFVRALIYFDLVRYFRGVPIVDKPLTISEAYSVTRATEEEVYDFIISDLKAAIGLLPDVKPKELPNRATVLAAKGFLGKVYVFQSGYPLNKNSWESAKGELEAVVNGIGQAGFFSKYEDIFLYENENKDQAVFSLGCQTNAQGEGNPYPSRNAPNGIKPGDTELTVPFGGSPWQLFFDDEILDDIFSEEGDERRVYSIQTEWEEKSGSIITNKPFVRKYQNGPISAASDWDIDWIMLRYTDVYMLYAEALYHTNNQAGALDIINKVRIRAGLTALTSAAISSVDSFTDVLLKERRREFCFENQRWGDLVRTDRAFDVMKKFLSRYGIADNLKSKEQYFYPIPERETNVSGIK
ncbi:RagB/SusD family nutrient uptake outer membrane protein [Parabacteroides sp. AF14-59]|uniref:RagB/SusD family nutrient uptake outer membrane protein n=1 Tax=Parabacteroides sp. AF14-59 TaxID=2292240 RepID=UPI001313E547|nr:RagB/SusD family nutrient uptake outer membrane protein [Parabacteroides sp. AF14-59]